MIACAVVFLLLFDYSSSFGDPSLIDLIKDIIGYNPNVIYEVTLQQYEYNSTFRCQVFFKYYGIKLVCIDFNGLLTWMSEDTKQNNDVYMKLRASLMNLGNLIDSNNEVWLRSIIRRWNTYPQVEIGPGAFKVDIRNYPPDTLSNDLKRLFAIKQRKEDREKG